MCSAQRYLNIRNVWSTAYTRTSRLTLTGLLPIPLRAAHEEAVSRSPLRSITPFRATESLFRPLRAELEYQGQMARAGGTSELSLSRGYSLHAQAILRCYSTGSSLTRRSFGKYRGTLIPREVLSIKKSFCKVFSLSTACEAQTGSCHVAEYS